MLDTMSGLGDAHALLKVVDVVELVPKERRLNIAFFRVYEEIYVLVISVVEGFAR